VDDQLFAELTKIKHDVVSLISDVRGLKVKESESERKIQDLQNDVSNLKHKISDLERKMR
jgi:predicted  nucleic acid-binding Zn-ribbon protein